MTEIITQLTVVRTINAPVELVFKAWTDPELLAKWWGPNGVTNPVCKLDLRPGGAIDIVMLAGKELGDLAGNEWPITGIFQEIIPPSKLVYTSTAILDDKPMIESMNTVTFEDQAGKTKMILSIAVTKATAAATIPLSGMETGWNQSLDKLTKQVEN